MKLQEYKKIDPKNYDYFDLCYQVYRFLKSPEFYQVIEKFDGKDYSKRLETALKNCAKSLAEKGYIDALNLEVTPDHYNGSCWLVTFTAEIHIWLKKHYSERIYFDLLRNETKLNAGNAILSENAFININTYKKALRKKLLKFIKTVKNYDEIKKEIEQKQKEFESWRNLINDQYSCYILEQIGLKYLR